MYITGIKEAKEMEEGGGFLTLVKTKPELGSRGMSLFYIPVSDNPGVSTTIFKAFGRRGLSLGGITFKDVNVPSDYLVGDENRGFYLTMEGFSLARGMIAVLCVGAALSVLEMGMDYIKRREAFGQPIGRFQSIQFKLAEDYSKLDAMRLLGYRALWMFDREQRAKQYTRLEVSQAAAEAKMLAVPTAFEVMSDVLQWYGAHGFLEGSPAEMGLRGVRSYMLGEGSNEIMKLIVAQNLLGKEFAATK